MPKGPKRELTDFMRYYKQYNISPTITRITERDIVKLQKKVQKEIREGCGSIGHQRKKEFLDRLYYLISFKDSVYEKNLKKIDIFIEKEQRKRTKKRLSK